MPARADTLVQRAGAKRLMAISEQDFREGRDGSRPGRGALDAVRDRPCDRQYGPSGDAVEADVKGFFDPRDHTRLLTMRRERLEDRALLRLIRQGLKAGVLETDGRVVPPETGAPHADASHPSWRMCIGMTRWTCGVRRR